MSKILFFLGAGASVNAGVPDTFKFVSEFTKYIRNKQQPEKIHTLEAVIKTIKE